MKAHHSSQWDLLAKRATQVLMDAKDLEDFQARQVLMENATTPTVLVVERRVLVV